MKKTRIPRSNILRNIINKKKNQKKYYNKKYYRIQRVKKYCDDKCKDELAQKKQLLHDKYKEKLSMMKKLRCGNISFAKVALKHARKYCIKSRARKCANKSFRYSLSCDMKFMKELKKLSRAVLMRK